MWPFTDAKEEFSNNPRELKRLVNIYHFYYNLVFARQSRDLPIPSTEQLKAWVMLSLAWPEVVRWLRRSYAEWERESIGCGSGHDSAIGKRLAQPEQFATQEIPTDKSGKS